MTSTLRPPVTSQAAATFSIHRILGPGLDGVGDSVKLHRPWTETEAQTETRENLHHLLHPHPPPPPQQQNLQTRTSSNWSVGRRPRTAFTDGQVKVLETVFHWNCYPGIQLREEVAQRLKLEEERIQLWFQNRRAKMRRSFRETRLQLLQTAVADLKASEVTELQLPLEEESE